MIKKLITLLYKDLLLVIKDKTGVGFLLVMPVTLVFIMTLLQKNAFDILHTGTFKVVIQNNDSDSLGNAIVRQFKKSGIFKVGEIPGTGDRSGSVDDLVAKGKYKVGITIPDSMTFYTRQAMDYKISLAFGEAGNSDSIKPGMPEIEICFDPVVRASYLMMIKSMLREFNSDFRTKILLKELNNRIPFLESEIGVDNTVTFKEKYATSSDRPGITPNAVQHNVPAWILFAMFFIVVSLAGNMVKEREDGSFARLRFMPVPYSFYISSKVIVYLAVCFIQFVLMLMVGVYIMPLLDLPALQITQFFPLFIVGLVSAMAAVGFGIFTGTFTRTYQQAAAFGALSVVILSAIGGIWVPVFMMPHAMQVVSAVSPLNWGIESFYNVLVRNLPLYDSLYEILLLISFFVLMMIASIVIYRLRVK